MRTLILIAITSLGLMLTSCGSYNQVSQGWQGATSPAESGQHGAYADQAPLNAPAEQIKSEHDVKSMDIPPSMEGSGNIAAQGNLNGQARK